MTLLVFSINSFVQATESQSVHAKMEDIEQLVLLKRQEALVLLDSVEKDESVLESKSLQSHLFNLKGYIEMMGGNYALSISHLQQARQLAIASGNKIQEAESYRREGALLVLFNQYSQALTLLDRSLQLHLETGSPKVTTSLSTILNIYEILNQSDQQIEYGWLLLEESIKFEDQTSIAIAHYSIGLVFLERGDFIQARYHFNQQKLANQKSSSSFIYLSHIAFSNLDKAEGHFLSALDNVKKAKTIIENADFRMALPSVLIVESEIRVAMGEVELAVQLLNRAIFVANEVGANQYQIEALDLLYQTYEKQGEIALALETLKRQNKLQTESQISMERQLLTINQAQLDLDTKKREIEQLKYEQQISDQRQTNQVLLLSFTVSVIFILGFFTLRLKQQKAALGEASKEIQRATNAKSDFLARMSHEIRTPLNAIIGLTKLSLRSSEDQRQATNLKQVEESSQTLLALINDILDFSKIEAGKMTLESVPFALDKVIDSAIRMNALKAREKGLELIKFVGPDVPLEIEGDTLRLQQVINNLLSNAVKFTSEGSISIVVNRRYSETDLLLQFEVKDTGRGLSTSQKETLFNSFSQADESITRKYGGTGLGLAISKQLVELMGGEIWVESVPSQGATFFFTVKTEQAVSAEILKSKSESDSITALIINTDTKANQLIKQTFERMRINSTIALDGMSGIEKMRQAHAQKQPYDIVMLDWNMPDIDGIEVISIVRQEINTNPPKIIVIAEDDSSGTQLLNQHSSFDDYLSKPLNASALFDCIIGMIKSPSKLPASADGVIHNSINLHNVHILLAEDNALNRKVALGYLKDTHAKVSVVVDGELAISKLKTDNSIDIILMDIQMPVMDGLSAAQVIRNELKLDIPIIAMTAHAIDEDIEKSVAVGMNAHIIKPIEPKILLETINDLIQSYRS